MGHSSGSGGSPPGGIAARIRAANAGSVGQAIRFVASGGLVSVLYIITTIVLSDVVGLPFEVALPIGYAVGITTHFTLQRFFVWAQEDDFALPLHHQLGRYLLVAGAQYGLTAASTSLLPGALGLPTEVVYVLTVGLIVCANFFVFRHGIFHAHAGAGDIDA
jgi:putative flippase GtrA